MKIKYKISQLDKTENGFICVFKKIDTINSINPFNPKQKCMLYLLIGDDKPNCEDCKMDYITINMED